MIVKKIIKWLFSFDTNTNHTEFSLKEENLNVQYDSRENADEKKPKTVCKNIQENKQYLEKRFSVPKSDDLVVRDLKINGDTKCFVSFFDGMADGKIIDAYIIKGLIELGKSENISESTVYNELLLHCQVEKTNDFDEICGGISFGGCVLFVDGIGTAFLMDTKAWATRGIDKPINEQSIYGPQESFCEMLRTNSALIRKILKTENLVSEPVSVGAVSKTKGEIMYLSNIANEKLVSEVIRRINGIELDFVISIEEVAMLVEEKTSILITQTAMTERPDRAARAIADGRVVFLLSGSPWALIFPTNIFELTHTASDSYLRMPYANFARFVRLFGMIFSVLLPGVYLATTLFHQEVLPTYLLYAISAARASVPLPSMAELVLMDFLFETIREAGLRIPGAIGQTLGIVGGLILGQAAVSAKIVSPLMIVVIAITGIGSFATADYSLSWSFRLLRIAFIILGGTFGFLGIATGIFAYSAYLASLDSFGIPFLSPFPGADKGEFLSSLFINNIWKNEMRPSFLYTKNKQKEPQISRKWKKN